MDVTGWRGFSPCYGQGELCPVGCQKVRCASQPWRSFQFGRARRRTASQDCRPLSSSRLPAALANHPTSTGPGGGTSSKLGGPTDTGGMGLGGNNTGGAGSGGTGTGDTGAGGTQTPSINSPSFGAGLGAERRSPGARRHWRGLGGSGEWGHVRKYARHPARIVHGYHGSVSPASQPHLVQLRLFPTTCGSQPATLNSSMDVPAKRLAWTWFSLNVFDLGGEKTFFDGWFSAYLDIPLLYAANNDSGQNKRYWQRQRRFQGRAVEGFANGQPPDGRLVGVAPPAMKPW